LAIESVMHKIPRLSRFFWFFNNDVFLGRPIELEDVFDVELWSPVHYLDLPVKPPRKTYTSYNKFLAFNARLLKERFNISMTRILPHIAGLYDRELFRWMENQLKDVIVSTRSHMFRSPDGNDVQMISLHGYLMELFYKRQPRRVILPEMGTMARHYTEFILLKSKTEEKDFQLYTERIQQLRPRFVCINDDVDVSKEDARNGRIILNRIDKNFKTLMQTIWPNPAPWELPA